MDEASRPSVSFTSTIAYRKFLEFLQLDGSETVVLDQREEDHRERKTGSEDRLNLSELLNLELKWPGNSLQGGDTSTSEASVTSMQTLNLDGIDLDALLPHNKEIQPTMSTEELNPREYLKITKNNLSVAKGFGMPQNYESSDAVMNVVNKSGQPVNSFSPWKAEFEEAISFPPPNRKLHDSFQGFSTREISHPQAGASLDQGNYTSFDSLDANLCTMDSTMASSHARQMETSRTFKEVQNNKPLEFSSASDDRLLNDEEQCAFLPFSRNAPETLEDVDWQDFISSDGMTQNANGQTRFRATGPYDDSEKTRFSMSPAVPSSFQRSDSNEVFFQEETCLSNRESNDATQIGTKLEDLEVNNGGGIHTVEHTCDDVDLLMSNMHDLSFMLADDLSIPKKYEDLSSFM